MMFPDASDDRQRTALRLAAQRAGAAGNGVGEPARSSENPSAHTSAVSGVGHTLTMPMGSWSPQQR
jgi:hypothetical protein